MRTAQKGLLLLLACLLLAKLVRSTLDTKEGYKTRSGCTNSVTKIRPYLGPRASKHDFEHI